MARDRNAQRAGMFIVLTLLAIVLVLYAVRGTSVLGTMQRRKIVFSLQDNIGGLRVGDNVRIGGFTVGSVQSIDLRQPADPGKQPELVVTVTVPEKYILRVGTKPQAESTVTGAASLNFVSLGTGDPLPADAEIPGAPSSFSELMAAAHTLVPTIQHILSSVDQKTIPEISDDLHVLARTGESINSLALSVRDKTLPNVDAVAGSIRDKLPPLLDNANGVVTTAKERLPALMDNVSATAGTLKEKLPGLMDNATSVAGSLKEKLPGLLDNVKTSLAGADKALTEVTSTFSNAKGITGDVKDVVASNKSRLTTIITSLQSASDNLKYATIEIRHSPWRLLYKPGENEVKNLNLYDTTRQFAQGAEALRDAAQAVNDASKARDLPAKDMQQLLDALQGSFDKFEAVEKKLYEGVK